MKIVARMFDDVVFVAVAVAVAVDVAAPAEGATDVDVDVDVKVGSKSLRNLTMSRSSEFRAAGLLS